jgi:hypothetical protein
MADEGDLARDAQRGEERFEIAPVLDQGVRIRSAAGQLLGVAHADQVGRDAPAARLEVRHDVAPQIGRGRVAVQEDDRVAPPGLDVGHRPVQHGAEPLLVGHDLADHLFPPSTEVVCPSSHLQCDGSQEARWDRTWRQTLRLTGPTVWRHQGGGSRSGRRASRLSPR